MSQKKILGKNPVTRWPIVERKSMAAATKIRLRNGAHGRSEIAVASRLPWETTPWCPKKFLIIETNKQTNKKLKNQPVTSSANRPRRTRQRCYRLVDFHEKSITNDEVKRKEQTDWNFLQLKRRKISINRWRHHPIVLGELGNVVVFFFWFPRKINNERSNQNQPIVVWERLQTGIIHLFSRCNCDPVLIYLRLPLFFFFFHRRPREEDREEEAREDDDDDGHDDDDDDEGENEEGTKREKNHAFFRVVFRFLFVARLGPMASYRVFLTEFFSVRGPLFFSLIFFSVFILFCLVVAAIASLVPQCAGCGKRKPGSTNQRRESASYALDPTRARPIRGADRRPTRWTPPAEPRACSSKANKQNKEKTKKRKSISIRSILWTDRCNGWLILLFLFRFFLVRFHFVTQLVKRCEQEINQLDRVQNLFPNDQLYLHDKDALSVVSLSCLSIADTHTHTHPHTHASSSWVKKPGKREREEKTRYNMDGSFIFFIIIFIFYFFAFSTSSSASSRAAAGPLSLTRYT